MHPETKVINVLPSHKLFHCWHLRKLEENTLESTKKEQKPKPPKFATISPPGLLQKHVEQLHEKVMFRFRKRICLDLKTLYHGGKKARINVSVCFLSDLLNIPSFHKHRREMLFTLLKSTEALFAWPLLQGKYYHLIQAVHTRPLNF